MTIVGSQEGVTGRRVTLTRLKPETRTEDTVGRFRNSTTRGMIKNSPDDSSPEHRTSSSWLSFGSGVWTKCHERGET